MSLTKPLIQRQKQRKSNHGFEHNEIKCEQPIIPMSKVSLDVIKKLQTQPYPQLNLATHSTISDALQLYYNEYARLFRQNQILNDQLASILLQRNNLADQFNQIKKMKSYDDNIRRRRRYASQIQRNYHCPMPKCNKGYGSQGSLTHHVRLKHAKFFQSGEYEIYLQTYILPKQQIKNEDGKGMIDVEELDDQFGDNSNEIRVKKNKIEISDNNEVKQAKQEDAINLTVGTSVKVPLLKENKKKNEKRDKQQKNELKEFKEPQNPLMTSMMRQVDGYILLESENVDKKKEKVDEKVIGEFTTSKSDEIQNKE